MLDEPYCSVKADSNICIYMCYSRSGGLRPPQQATIRITIRLGAECVHSMIIRSDGGRNLIGRRTRSDWTANAIRLDGGRNPIGRRTQSDWTANAGETVLVSDVAGKTVATAKASAESTALSLSNVPAGLYIVKTDLGARKFVKK